MRPKAAPSASSSGPIGPVVPTCRALEIKPAPTVAAVEVLELDAGFLEELGHRRPLHAASFSDESLPGHVQGLLDVVQHDLLSDSVELDVAASRQGREALLDVSLQPATRAAGERPEP